MSEYFCSDCKRETEVVFDHSAGDTVCSECGLVLESRSIDETSEWRTFANESNDNDPNRVGSASNPLLTDGGLSTYIAKPNGSSGEFLSPTLNRLQNRASNHDRTLLLAFKNITTMAERSVGFLYYFLFVYKCAFSTYNIISETKKFDSFLFFIYLDLTLTNKNLQEHAIA